ncbi:MAG: endopeptidase La [Candidatus Hydrogenedentes bacterium]|nr:endopeptidase La [Candidatus Hydrogenedentota bacterium]
MVEDKKDRDDVGADKQPHDGDQISFEEIPSEICILPIRNMVMFPVMVVPLDVGRPRSLAAISEAALGNKLLGLVTQKEAEIEEPTFDDLYTVGTITRVLRLLRMPDGHQQVLAQGLVRFRILDVVAEEPFMKARIEVIESPAEPEGSTHTDALLITLRDQARELIELSPNVPQDAMAVVRNINDSGTLLDLIAANLDISIEEKQGLLETIDLRERYERMAPLMARQIEVLKLSQDIRSEVSNSIERAQREAILREQLKAIQKELGEGDAHSADMDEIKQRISETDMPEEVEQEALHELDRLSRMHPSAAEYSVTRTYIEWLIDMPWRTGTKDRLNIRTASKVLDEDHYDLEKVKKRMLEYLAVRKLKSDTKGPILCFVGPPGVGKTSLGMSIARALGRKFVRMSLGGVHDEAEIRGHRRTYVGAMPGRIIQGIRRAESNNPVFMLDEIDKIGQDFRGDPSSALLEVLDPEQNHSFTDHYLGVPFDLSQVMFITTANVLDTIPPALRDRMEVLDLPGYTDHEKLFIAQKFLVSRQIAEHGLTPKQIKFRVDALRTIISAYTREAGVRNLEREIAAVCRGVARKFAERRRRKPVSIGKNDLQKFLGPQKFYSEVAERTKVPGVATGLAWTPTGGTILFVEATMMRGKGNLTLTGQLGDVMKESAQTALSYIRSRAAELGIDETIFEKTDVHIHVPAGAIPKDGPSAGVTMYMALVSLLLDRPVRNDTALSGEITLRGMVLPVGGVKEKVLAAKRAGISRVVLPSKNEKDLEEVPEEIRKTMRFEYVNRMDDVPALVLGRRLRRSNKK